MTGQKRVRLDTSTPIWDRFHFVAPLVLIGTRDGDGALDLAPKHMVTPLGWQNYFGFVCTESHGTCFNIARTGEFTVSYPKPAQVFSAGLAASARTEAGHKPVLDRLPTFPAEHVDGAFIEDAYLFLECRHFKTIDGFGVNCLITGEIVAAQVDAEYLRDAQRSDHEVIRSSPLLAYLPPGRFATIEESSQFPFPPEMKK